MTAATAQHTEHNANVDNAEIAKFERAANRWWDAEGEFKPLHQMNPVRANFIDRCAKVCLLYTSPSPRDKRQSRMPSSA